MWHRIDLALLEIDGGSCIPVVVGGQISDNSNENYGFSSEEYSYDYTTGSSVNYVGNSIIYNINYNQYWYWLLICFLINDNECKSILLIP